MNQARAELGPKNITNEGPVTRLETARRELVELPAKRADVRVNYASTLMNGTLDSSADPQINRAALQQLTLALRDKPELGIRIENNKAHTMLHQRLMSNAALANGSSDNLFVRALKNKGGQTAVTELRQWEETLRRGNSGTEKDP